MILNVTASTQTKGDTYYTVIRWRVTDDSGKAKWKSKWINTGLSVSGNNKRAAERRRLEDQREWEAKLSCKENNMLFSDYLVQWAEDTRSEIATSTYSNNMLTLNGAIIPWFKSKGIRLCDLKTKDIQDFYKNRMKEHGVSGSTIRRYHVMIRKALRYAVDEERILVNPAQKVKLPKAEKHVANFYTTEELKKLLECAKGTPLETVVNLAAWFGLRRGEIIGLKWNAIDFENRTLSVLGVVRDKSEGRQRIEDLSFVPEAKTRSSIRTFPMSQQAVDYLKEVKAKQDKQMKLKSYNHKWDGFVCVRPTGDIIPPVYVSHTFRGSAAFHVVRTDLWFQV